MDCLESLHLPVAALVSDLEDGVLLRVHPEDVVGEHIDGEIPGKVQFN